MRAGGRTSLGVAALLLVAPSAWPASFPPHLHFRSVSTERVTVHFHQGLEATARQAAAMATEILQAHESRYAHRVGRVQIVLTDVADDPNGFATPLPYPLVYVRAAAPDGSDDFGNYETWLRLVLTHELAHIVHLDESHGLLGVARALFGRAPFAFLNGLTPTWMVEGLATYEETRGTAFGRGRNPDTRMVLRMAALEGDFPREDRPVAGLDRWPGGEAEYFFGEAFLRDLTARFGERTLPDLARVHSGRPIPFLDDLTAQKVTGASFHARWREWASSSRAAFEGEAARVEARGLTQSRALTSRGARQTSPRFSPDGAWIAYTSGTLTRFRQIRLVRPDGTGDRKLADRNGGTSLAWSSDGRSIVFDEPEIYHLFSTYSDLRVVEVARGRVRRLTSGLRARDPDVSPDRKTVVFARRMADRSELCTIGLDGDRLRTVTRSEAGTEWNHPRWSPRGDAIVASRWKGGGWLDLVRVDPESGEVVDLTHDRAKDVEATWTPDGSHIVFRSDREGISNLYALRLADGALLRLTNVLGGTFAPDVAPDGRRLAFASYGARGYDVRVTDIDLASAPPVEPFSDPYPEPRAAPAPCAGKDRPYRPLPAALPRFWSPFVDRSAGETRYGVATAGLDPLFRHAYGVEVHRGADTGRFGFAGFYQYDRFRPKFLVLTQKKTEPRGQGLETTREITLQATFPLTASVRRSQSVFLAWRRKRETVETGPDAGRLDLGGVEAGYTFSTVKRYPYSISPVDGYWTRLAYLKEDTALGSRVSLAKATADARAYWRLFGESDVLALRVGGGATFGSPRFMESFAVGGFPDASLLDLVDTNVSVLRGYPENGGLLAARQGFIGRKLAEANLEYRFPLAHPQSGLRLLPLFLRHVHAAVFGDAARAWSLAFRLRDMKTSAGAALGADVFVFHAVPLTATAGIAHGFAATGGTLGYFRVGLSF